MESSRAHSGRRVFAVICALALIGFSGHTVAESFPPTLKKPDIDLLVARQSEETAADFPAFLQKAASVKPALKKAVLAYRAGARLEGDDLVNIARLLGAYSRVQLHEQVISTLGQMVALPTVRDAGVPQHLSPAIVTFGKLVEGLARDFGLEFRNVDNRVFEVRLRGRGPQEFGVLTHADVVPVVADEWVLKDGTRLDPFKLTRVGGLLYGRGTIDDKGSIATVMYAMKAVKDSGLTLERTVRLMIETTEETGGDGMRYYREKTRLPEYNIVLDSRYPAVVAEKGSGALKVVLPLGPEDFRETAIVSMAASASSSAIPQTATATLRGGDLVRTAAMLEAAKAAFIRKYEGQGGAFSIDINSSGDRLLVKLTGVSAHGSRPEEGVNPLPRLALFLNEFAAVFRDNGYKKAVAYIVDLYGIDYFGRQLDLAYGDDFMGPLTMSPTMVGEKSGKVEVTVNVRIPRGRSSKQMIDAVNAKVNAWAAARGAKMEIDYRQGDWMARDPKGAWLTTLLNIFGDNTGMEAKPTSTAGGTTAKLMPNAINFGPAMPGKKYTAHNANEYKEVADLDIDMQMFVEMLVRIGNLDRME